jgi:hypothetical protein
VRLACSVAFCVGVEGEHVRSVLRDADGEATVATAELEHSSALEVAESM